MFNTMKRKMFFRLTAVCLIAVSALIACTQDYGSDIQELQNKVDKLDNDVQALDALIKAGNVITDVTPITGGTRVTLSNGKTFDVLNGANGEDGDDGAPGTVWKIDQASGNWMVDYGDGQGFQMTDYPSRGAQGPIGPTGPQGPQGVGIKNVTLNPDYTLTITLDDEAGTIFRTTSIRGEQGPIGPEGPQGVGIQGAVLNDDYTLTLTFTDGTQYTTPSIRGEQGPIGPQGPQGVGVASTTLNDDYTLTIKLTDGTEYTTGSLRGEKGEPGRNGDWYTPCVDQTNTEDYGHWIKHPGDGSDPEVLDDLWLPEGTITAVWDEDTQTVTFHNVEGADEGVVEISLSLGLTSLALIPEMWDASLGMPTAQVYAITPSAWETARAIFGKNSNLPRFLEWFSQQGGAGLNGTWAQFDKTVSPAYWNYQFWCTLYNSYLGVTGQKNAQGVTYDSHFDVYSQDFNYWWEDHFLDASYDYELTYADFANAVTEMIDLMGDRLRTVASQPVNFTRQPPVSDLNLKYRMNPAGADLTGYKYYMLDRTLQVVNSKADGDNRNEAVVIKSDGVKQSGKDQLNVTGYVNYFKYWADKPADWFIMVMTTTAALSWDYWQQNLMYNSVPTAQYAGTAQNMGAYTGSAAFGGTANFAPAYNAMRDWLKAQDIKYETILALEAAKTNKGDEAIVSDYTAVQLQFVTPIWTAYNVHKRYDGHYAPVGLWPIAPNMAQFQMWDNFPASSGIPQALGGLDPRTYYNDLLQVNKEYDVASHMRFADPYYGRLEDLGFNVKYDYYVYEAANSGTQDYWSTWADNDSNPKGETETNYGAWNKVNCTPEGVVTVKKDEDGNYVSGAVGKFVIITADAAIENKATGTWYNSSTRGATGGVTYMSCNVDEFTGHYVLFIIPDPSQDVFIPKDLGEIDYLALPDSGKFTVPTSLVYEDERVNMDMDGFQRVYESTGTTTIPGVSVTWTAAGGFVVTVDNTIASENWLIDPSEKVITVVFAPKAEYANQNFPNICVSFGFNVTINWALTEPVLNPDYILYDDAERTQLTKTIINPDPATLPAWQDYRTDPLDMTKVPYVDSIVMVKGKDVAGTWKPQTSIKEHIKDYGQYLDAQPNVANLTMSIDWANTKFADGTQVPNTSAEITATATSTPQYKWQEMLMKESFKAYEQYRDYLVNITVKLQNGTEKVVKAYIVRFVNPFKLMVTDVVLHTHKKDWCACPANIKILDADDETKVIYDFATNTVDAAYNDIYPGILTALADEANKPKFMLVKPVDPSFGTLLDPGTGNLEDAYQTENLRVDPTSGWFYWRNLGTDLQTDKVTKYEVTLNIPGVAVLADKGDVKVLSVANSNVFHADHDADTVYPYTATDGTVYETPQPGDHIRNTWEIIFE